MFTDVVNPRGMLRDLEHKPEASDLQALLVSSQHIKWVYYAIEPKENVFYCFHKTIISSSNFLRVYRHNNL